MHQGKGCARVSHMPGCHCKQKQELSQRGSFPWAHGIAGLAPQPHSKQTGCPARTQQCLPCLGSHSTADLCNGLLPAFLLCCFFSFFLHLLPNSRFLPVVPLSPSHCCSIPSQAWGEFPKHTCMNAQICKCHIFFLNGIRSSYIPRHLHLCMSFHRGCNCI